MDAQEEEVSVYSAGGLLCKQYQKGGRKKTFDVNEQIPAWISQYPGVITF